MTVTSFPNSSFVDKTVHNMILLSVRQMFRIDVCINRFSVCYGSNCGSVSLIAFVDNCAVLEVDLVIV